MLDAKIKSELEHYMSHLKSPVELVVFLDESKEAKELKNLVDELTGLSPNIKATKAPNITATEGNSGSEKTPCLLVRSVAKGTEIRFAGVPMGHEFTSLVLALLHSGGHPIKVNEDLIKQVRELEGEYQFETYISLSCQTCPDVVQALNMMAAINPKIRHTMIDGALFETEVKQRNILAVPAVFLNGKLFSQGRISLADIVKKIDTNADKREAESLNKKGVFDMLIIGGGPAGASAAIYGARKGIKTDIVAEHFGGQMLDTMAIENFISVKRTEGSKMVAGLEEHVRDYNADIMDNQRAVAIREHPLLKNAVEVELKNGARLASRSVLLATGARWREVNVPGEREYRGKGVAYCPHCDGPLFKGKKVAVIGGGNSGIEAAIDLANIVEHVTVLEFDSKLRADRVLQDKVFSLPNVDVITSAQTREISGDGEKVTGLEYIDRNSGEKKQIALAGIFVQIGLVPNTEFLKGTIELSSYGEIITGARGETSMKGVYAAGDATNIAFKQIIIAMGSGATAALGAFDYLVRLPNAVENKSAAA